jgi:Ca-activated chloride channel family protein
MAQQISSKSAIRSGQSAIGAHLGSGNPAAHCLLPIGTVVVILMTLSNLHAGSLASKNKEGNRFFAQGKYQEAERAYLDAQVNSPGRPEILYNLGNSLIKQKKYNQGIQALHQSMNKGDSGIKENSWFNEGNALFLMGNYKDSVQAYIQSLRLDPTDRDAKHNLELALMKLKQQEQRDSNNNREQKDSEKPNQNQSNNGKANRNQSGNNGPVGSAKRNETHEFEKPQTAQPAQHKDSISKEQALQILDAVQSQELEEQRKLLEGRARRRSNGKDW